MRMWPAVRYSSEHKNCQHFVESIEKLNEGKKRKMSKTSRTHEKMSDVNIDNSTYACIGSILLLVAAATNAIEQRERERNRISGYRKYFILLFTYTQRIVVY